MARFAVLLVLFVTGCRCGTYTHQTGLLDATDPSVSLDDYELYEICGADAGGSFGVADLLGDGVAWIDFDGTHDNTHVSMITSGIFNDVYFPTDQLVAGTTVDILRSVAYVVQGDGSSVSGADYTRGEVEILEVSDEVDDIWSTRDYRVRWDLTWGEPGQSEFWYTAEGEDWIPMTEGGA